MNTDDLVVIGAGAAGLATAIFAARRQRRLRIRCIDGAKHLGAKILVSGGSRCNVTNRVVTERDFWGGSPAVVRNVLRAFPAARAAAFFEDLGVALHEEDDGKLFPDTNRSRTVLDALLAEAAACGVTVAGDHRVVSLARAGDLFVVGISGGREVMARAVVLATGGRSLPKTGSDGFGYELARRFGHRVVDTTPALAPLLLGGERHVLLRGVAHHAEATLRVDGKVRIRLEGDWLWTHFGASGPLALNLSRHWHREALTGEPDTARPTGETGAAHRAERVPRSGPAVSLSLFPGDTFESLEAWLLEQERHRPRAQVGTVLATRLPAALSAAWLEDAGIPRDTTFAHLAREDRRRLVHALLATPLDVRGSRGYQYAEVTAGGVALDEVDAATLQSRLCPGLYFAGEILDVDGRLGGFNFQWAWSSGFVAGHGATREAPGRPAGK